ncbi:hypothetical protein LWI29_034097 [Acer saccharum]|uniref:J domain-containing protein n=1 Tax=Acer saccharum TaxID=4024 RepID=A0AA39RJY6_ACESA|nr:hypothetical protein LWI29_034097 [Acer saccharum]
MSSSSSSSSSNVHNILFSDVDEEAVESLLDKLEDKEAKACKDIAEDFFQQQNIDMAMFCLATARAKDPNLADIERYKQAYVAHKVVSKKSKMRNWPYVVLGIKDYGVGVEEIERSYKRKALMFHPDKFSSVAANTAMKHINAAREILSDSRTRNALHKVMQNLRY